MYPTEPKLAEDPPHHAPDIQLSHGIPQRDMPSPSVRGLSLREAIPPQAHVTFQIDTYQPCPG
jgi:hypothetical protein